MKRNTRKYICALVQNGPIDILDSTTFKVVKSWKAHAGVIGDFDAQHDYIVTCGYALRQANHWIPDRFVNVFDLKNMVSLNPVPSPAGAAFVRMHPRMSTTVIIASQQGQIHMTDLLNVNSGNLRQAMVMGYITMMEIAPSGEAIALADSECNILVWGSPTRLKFAEFAVPTEHSDYQAPQKHLGWDENEPLNLIGMPYYREQLLSAWPGNMVYDIGSPPVKLDPSFINSLVRDTWFLKGPNTRNTPRRNQAENTRQKLSAPAGVEAPKFLSEKAREEQKVGAAEKTSDMTSNISAAERLSLKAEVPVVYRNVEIKYSKFGIDDFDFAWVAISPLWPSTDAASDSTTRRNIQVSRHTLLIHMLIRSFNCYTSHQ
jgi:PAB-dependent poly(A)-specific ribonuclease subunit 2